MPLPLQSPALLRAAQVSPPSFHMSYAGYEEFFSHYESIEIRFAWRRSVKEPEDFWVACMRAVGGGDRFAHPDDLHKRLEDSCGDVLTAEAMVDPLRQVTGGRLPVMERKMLEKATQVQWMVLEWNFRAVILETPDGWWSAVWYTTA